MEKFEMEEERNLETFNSYTNKAKDAFVTLIDDIKNNLKKYEQKIEDTSKDISENESSREKCEKEITKMQRKIETIKENIDNVEKTYKQMVDAYASTSKGETKELYSDIIESAKSNCDKEVDKNRTEISRLNSDIEAIKNNITEFNRIINELNNILENSKVELSKYNKCLEYISEIYEKVSTDLDDISTIQNEEAEEVILDVQEESEEIDIPSEEELNLDEAEDIVPEEEEISNDFSLEEPLMVAEEPEEKQTEETSPYEDSLKQIFDLTGYKPKQETEQEIEEPKEEIKEEPIYNDNLENLFKTESTEKVENPSSFDETNMSEWEKILNGADDVYSNLTREIEPIKENSDAEDTADQLLKPYGSTFKRLSSLLADKITYKDGTTVPFEMTPEDVVKAINEVDGNDLKMMKTVGSEITLLRKVKHMKEGRI